LCNEGAIVLSEFLMFAALVDEGFAEQNQFEGTDLVDCLVAVFACLVKYSHYFSREVVSEVKGRACEKLFPVK